MTTYKLLSRHYTTCHAKESGLTIRRVLKFISCPLTSTQHLFMQRAEAGQTEDSGRDVRPQTHGTQSGLRAALPERSDVQTRHLVLHLCGTANVGGERARERGKKKKKEQLIHQFMLVNFTNKLD